jgi:hypothetical protein
MCAGIKAGKLLQYFGASRRLESNNSASVHYMRWRKGFLLRPFAKESRENLHEQDVVIERERGWFLHLMPKILSTCEKTSDMIALSRLMAMAREGWFRWEWNSNAWERKMSVLLRERGGRGRQAPGKF